MLSRRPRSFVRGYGALCALKGRGSDPCGANTCSVNASSERSASDATPDDALIGYLRAELANLQARLDRADSKAASVLTAAFTAGGLAATGIASLQPSFGPQEWIPAAIGAGFLLIAIFMAIQVRDEAEKQDWFGKFFNDGLHILRERAAWLLDHRKDFRKKAAISLADPGAARGLIAENLVQRIGAGAELAWWNEKAAQTAMLVLFFGVALLVVAVIITILH